MTAPSGLTSLEPYLPSSGQPPFTQAFGTGLIQESLRLNGKKDRNLLFTLLSMAAQRLYVNIYTNINAVSLAGSLVLKEKAFLFNSMSPRKFSVWAH